MPGIDLSENVANALLTDAVGGFNATMQDARNNGSLAAAARNFDELGVAESRAVSGVMATPVASPTTQSGS